ncbi:MULTISPECIES: hypothetical protein [Brucella]|uniref:hypothetical protein n=1 Tax=Brucella TaxID=234 RepID=UPI0013CE9BCB
MSWKIPVRPWLPRINRLILRGVETGVFRDDIKPHDLLRALSGLAHVRPSKNWKR